MHSRNETGKSTYRCGAIIAYIDITNFFSKFYSRFEIIFKRKKLSINQTNPFEY